MTNISQKYVELVGDLLPYHTVIEPVKKGLKNIANMTTPVLLPHGFVVRLSTAKGTGVPFDNIADFVKKFSENQKINFEEKYGYSLFLNFNQVKEDIDKSVKWLETNELEHVKNSAMLEAYYNCYVPSYPRQRYFSGINKYELGQSELIIEFLNKAKKNVTDHEKLPALFDKLLTNACERLDMKLMKFFLNQKVEPKNHHYDAVMGKTYDQSRGECIKILIDYGYDIKYEQVLDFAKLGFAIPNIQDKFTLDDKYKEIVMTNRVNPYNVHINYTCENIKKKITDGQYYDIHGMLINGAVPDKECFDKYVAMAGYLDKNVIKIFIKLGIEMSDVTKQKLDAQFGPAIIDKLVQQAKPKEKKKIVKKVTKKAVEVEVEAGA